MSLPVAGTTTTAVVTGASSGIGAEMARALAARGQQVTLVARSEDKLRALADEIAASGVRADVVTADLADRSERAALHGRIEELGLTPSILVNNAGWSTTGPVAEADPEAELGMIEVDVAAVVDLSTRFVPGLVRRGSGAILNVASTAAFQPLPGQAAYAASKAFVLSYTEALRAELHGTGVSVTALCPGPVATNFVETAGFTDAEATKAMPSIMWIDAADVAKAAIDGLDKGRRVVIPGVANKLSAKSALFVPRKVLLPVLAKNHPALHRD